MKSKRLLALLIVVAVVIVIIVVFASVFAVRRVLPVYHNFEGGEMTATEGAPTADDVLSLCGGKNILFLSKQQLIDNLNTNEKFDGWHVIGIVKSFPNILEVHIVKRVAVVCLNVGGEPVYIDSFGYVTSTPDDGERINVTSAFSVPAGAKVCTEGEKFEFDTEENNNRLSYILQSIMALWQCKCEIEDIPTILGAWDEEQQKIVKSNVFTFDNGTMTISTGVGAKIRIMDPATTLTDKIIDAFSVYCNDEGLQKAGVILEVYPNGKIVRPTNT